MVPYTSCVVLPDDVAAQDYRGSLVNAITAYAFLEKMTAAIPRLGWAMAALTQERTFQRFSFGEASEKGALVIFICSSEQDNVYRIEALLYRLEDVRSISVVLTAEMQ